MTPRSRLALAIACLVALGCAARPRGAAPASSPPAAPLSAVMLGTSVGGLAGGDALDRLFGAPEVTAAGERLLGRLGQEPSLVPLYDGFVLGLFGQPALLEAFAAMALEEPGISVDALTAKAVARLSAGIDGPVFDAALDGSIDRLLERPMVDAAFGRLAETMVERARITDRLAALVLEWRPELEAAVGVPMTDERFGPRFEQHLADPARAEAIRRLFADRLVDDPGVRRGLAALLDDDAFVGSCAVVVRTLLQSPGLDERASAVLGGMLDEVDAEELGRRVDRVLVTAEIEAAVAAWTDEVAASAAFGTLADRLGLVLEDPNLRAELLAIVVGAPANRTALRPADPPLRGIHGRHPRGA
jgi:hypothetical protein